MVREVKEEPKKRKVRKMLQIGLFFILFWPILHIVWKRNGKRIPENHCSMSNGLVICCRFSRNNRGTPSNPSVALERALDLKHYRDLFKDFC